MFNTLLVEGDTSFRQALSDTLLAYFPFIDVDQVPNGEEALSKIEYWRPHLIFIDIHLPGENGLEITKKIKQVYHDIVIVILTASSQPGLRLLAFQSGADCFLSKNDDSCMDAILALIEGIEEMESDHGNSRNSN